MKPENQSPIRLRPWRQGDLPLLQKLLGDPAMMEYLGGAEMPEQIARRHERYLNLNGDETGQMYVILAGNESAGSIGYWEHEMGGQTDYETGWSVLPAFQGQNIATGATLALIDLLQPIAQHRYLHAFPMTTNAASNAVCKKAGFILLGAFEFEYPKGNPIICNDWRFDLQVDPAPDSPIS